MPKAHLAIYLIIFALVGGTILLLSHAAPNPNLQGDLNNDNKVDGLDLSFLAANYKTHTASADINGDGIVDIADLALLLENYGKSISSFTTNITQNQTITTPFTWTFNPGVATTAGYFFADGTQLAKVSGPGPYSFNITTSTLSAGTHTLGGSWDLSDGTHVTFPQAYTVTIDNGSSGGGGTLGSSLPARLPQSTGSGGTFYVSPTGSDSNNGSQSSPWQTINHALGTVPLSGSIIKLNPGTYYSYGTSSYAINFSRAGDTSNPVTLEAATPGTVTIANNSPSTSATFGAWVHGATGLRIQGITFHIVNDASLQSGYGEVLIENSSRVEVTNCTFNETAGQGVMVRGGPSAGQTANDDWIFDNIFRPSGSNVYAQVTGLGFPNNVYFGSKGSHWIYGGQYAADPSNGNWDYTNGSSRLVISNNVFVGAAAGRDIELGPQARDGFIVNNTFFGNRSVQTIGLGDPSNDASAAYGGQGLVFFGNSGNPLYNTGNNIASNNIFMNLSGHAVGGSGGTESGNIVQKNLSYGLYNGLYNGTAYDGDTSLDYMYYYETTSTILFSTGTGNYTDADPLFVDPLNYNYQLQAGSPAIGKADPAYTYPYDISGKARHSAPDLGAYEH